VRTTCVRPDRQRGVSAPTHGYAARPGSPIDFDEHLSACLPATPPCARLLPAGHRRLVRVPTADFLDDPPPTGDGSSWSAASKEFPHHEQLPPELAPISYQHGPTSSPEAGGPSPGNVAARRVVDLNRPRQGAPLPGIFTGHLLAIEPPADAAERAASRCGRRGVPGAIRVSRQAVDDVDLAPRTPTGSRLKDSARHIAYVGRVVSRGVGGRRITWYRASTSNPTLELPHRLR